MLPVTQQLYLAAVEAPIAARKLRGRSALWLAGYIGAAAGLLALVAWQLVRHEDDILQLAMDYLVPSDWQWATRSLVHRFFANQEQLVVSNAVVIAALLVVQITLFPVKEKVSAVLEEDAKLVGEPIEEHPLWFQAWEEIKVFLALLAAQGCIFWLGYSDDPVRRKLAVVASFLVLAINVAVDFLSPVLQRHKLRYSQIVKSLAAHPLLTLVFGALFALPAIGATALAGAHPEWSFGARICVAFGGQVLGVALAVLGGTVAGAPLLEDARARPVAHWLFRLVGWTLLVGALAWNGVRFGTVARSLHHKSQIFKCHYSVDWGSFHAQTPSTLDLIDAARKDSITVGVTFDVTVDNPTHVDIEIEDNRLEFRQAGQLIAQTSVPRANVHAHTKQLVHVTLPLTIRPSQALRIRELWTTKNWTITWFLQVTPDFTFPVYLLTNP